MSEEKKDLVCKIHRFEDKLLRSHNIYDQLELQTFIMNFRMQLQNLEWKEQRTRVC